MLLDEFRGLGLHLRAGHSQEVQRNGLRSALNSAQQKTNRVGLLSPHDWQCNGERTTNFESNAEGDADNEIAASTPAKELLVLEHLNNGSTGKIARQKAETTQTLMQRK